MATKMWWRYNVVEVGGVMEGRVDVGATLLDWTESTPDNDWRDYHVMQGDDPCAGWICCEVLGPYEGPFGDDGRPCSDTAAEAER